MAETYYYPSTLTLSAPSFTGNSQISGLLFASANVQVFTSPGTWTKNVQSNVVVIECWGGGGGGGATNGGGGGGGAYVQVWYPGKSAGFTSNLGPVSSLSVTVGAAAVPGVAGNPTSVGALVIAYGGAVGTTGPGTAGGRGGAMDASGTQGAGPAGASPGGAGGAATFYGGGGGGGGSATSGGVGGASVWGGGGGGGGAITGGVRGLSIFGGSGGSGSTGAGNPGIFPGGGGGGGFGGGGPGGAGYVRITSF